MLAWVDVNISIKSTIYFFSNSYLEIVSFVPNCKKFVFLYVQFLLSTQDFYTTARLLNHSKNDL